MAKAIAIKPEEQSARAYVDRLILEKLAETEGVVKLSELADRLGEHGVGLATVRSLLASNPDRFAYHERKWVPASRIAGQGRPFGAVLNMVLSAFGAPVAIELVAAEIARIREEDEMIARERIERLAERDPQFVLVAGKLGLTSFGFVATDEKLARALDLNLITPEAFEAAAAKLAGADFTTPEGILAAAEKAAPISLKEFGAVAYSVLSPDDPRAFHLYDAQEFLAIVLGSPKLALSGDGMLSHAEDAKRWVALAEKVAEKLTPTIDVDDATPIEIKPEDVDRLVARVTGGEGTTTATKMLEEFYEITPGTKTFPDDLSNLIASLRTANAVQWVGGDRFRVAGAVPEYILEVPEPFYFPQSGVLDEEGEPVDVELTDDGLSTTLRKLLQHPLATDVLDEDPIPVQKSMPDTIRLVLKSVHRELGTFPLCQFPAGWFDAQPKIQEVILRDPAGRELQVWLNNETRLLYGFIDWWYEQAIESGAVFTLTRTNKPNVFDFGWEDQPDPVVYISAQRMEELRRIGTAGEGRSTLDLLVEVMAHWPKGADYLTILAELNVARRASRRLVASLLSSYSCFYVRSGSPVWHYDAKKLELGFDKTKKKFIKK